MGLTRRLCQWALLAVLPLVAVATPPSPTRAQVASAKGAATPDPKAAFARLESWVNKHGGKLAAMAVDLNTGKRWVAIHPEGAMNPASNQKLVTAAVALDLLGGNSRFRTSLYGSLDGSVVRDLTLTGHGDPALSSAELWRLAHALHAQGVRRVHGDILVDQGRFDEHFEPPAYDQQPEEWAGFRAPVSAISVDQNTVTLNVLAGEAGQPARVWYEPAGFVQTKGSVLTKPQGQGQGVTWRLTPGKQGLVSEVGGHVAEQQPRLRFVRRVADPRPLPGKVLARLLREVGIRFEGQVKLGPQRAQQRLAYVTSPPLTQLLHQLGKHSDNFYAETIFKALGDDGKTPASSQAAAKRVSEWLKKLGVASKHTRIGNGSGLFDANRLSVATLGELLAKVYLDPRLGPDFVAQLAIGGLDGTLRSRFRGSSTLGRVRAKTGTLRNVDALGGYVLSSSGRLPIVFVVIVNGVENRHTQVRREIDSAVTVLAEAS